MKYSYLIYTHTEYSDILEITLKRIKKYFPIKVTSATNNAKETLRMCNDTDQVENIIEYQDNLPYGSKLLSVLNNISTEYLLFNHDVNILFNHVDQDVISHLISIMSEQKIDSIRLSTSGINEKIKKNINTTVYNIISKDSYQLTVQPTLWRTSSFIDICSKLKDINYRDFEVEKSQMYASKQKNCYISNINDIHVVANYYLARCYPCMHSIYRAKWNIIQHAKEIKDLEEYGIDLMVRGVQLGNMFWN